MGGFSKQAAWVIFRKRAMLSRGQGQSSAPRLAGIYLEGTLAGGGVSSERDNELVVAYMPATDDTENDRTTFVFFPIALARATQDRVSPTKVRKVPQKSS
jgi:hypothetical protein